MFRQPGKGDEREPVSLPLPPDIRVTLASPPSVLPVHAPRRLPAHSRDERRLARIDRKVAERDQSTD
ncbi:hypothetical protein [Conyzicola sp.]|uniref:hypothetical protein n=1 Tax=Conyzicola sp. TaxID=1969404 RepID=UPI0039894594